MLLFGGKIQNLGRKFPPLKALKKTLVEAAVVESVLSPEKTTVIIRILRMIQFHVRKSISGIYVNLTYVAKPES